MRSVGCTDIQGKSIPGRTDSKYRARGKNESGLFEGQNARQPKQREPRGRAAREEDREGGRGQVPKDLVGSEGA